MSTYEDHFPREQGPPPVPNYTGKKLHDALTPTYTVEFDSGAFMALWEHMEAEAKRVFPTHATYASTRAYLRGIKSLRKAYWAQHPQAAQAPKKLVRKDRKSG
jgi:hypothetical protein